MTEQQFESAVLELLNQQFSGPNDPGLASRLARLKAVFQSVNDADLAVKLYERLSDSGAGDKLGAAFQGRLSTSARRELLAELTKVKGPAPKVMRGQEYKLIDEDAKTVRTIAHSDEEYQDRYINHDIKNVTSDPDPNTFEFHTMIVHYDDGRMIALSLDDVPVRTSIPGMLKVRISPYQPPTIDHYVRRSGVIIPMGADDHMILGDKTTPILVDLRTAVEINIQRRHTLLEIASAAYAFAGLLQMNISFLHMAVSSSENGLFVRAMKTNAPQKNGGPPSAPVRFSKQYKQVTMREFLMWEKAGGHMLSRHNEEMTEQKLLERIVGEETLKVEPAKTTGKPEDFSVWRGKTTSAASKWADRATMMKAVGQMIHDNIDEIRRTAVGNGEWKREGVPVGYKTGAGWVVTANKGSPGRAAYWDEQLKGVTILIRARKNFTPTADDPEPWYVYTAFPDRVRR